MRNEDKYQKRNIRLASRHKSLKKATNKKGVKHNKENKKKTEKSRARSRKKEEIGE